MVAAKGGVVMNTDGVMVVEDRLSPQIKRLLMLVSVNIR
jgi:hypothetical protein